MRTAFIETLCQLAAQDDRIWLLCGDLGYSVLERFANVYPNRYLNVGVAEQNMMGVAAGLALEGKIVFTYSIANFPIMRCFEQIRNDICYHNLSVKIVAVGGGMAYGAAGYSHHGLEDLAVTRALPNIMVMAPGDPVEARIVTQAIAQHPGPGYIRLGKGGEATIHRVPPVFEPGKTILVRGHPGSRAAFLTTGAILSEADQAAALLAEQEIYVDVISVPSLKPFHLSNLDQFSRYSRLITVEEHGEIGGLGDTIAALLQKTHSPIQLECLNISSPITVPGSQTYLRKLAGLDASHLVKHVIKANL